MKVEQKSMMQKSGTKGKERKTKKKKKKLDSYHQEIEEKERCDPERGKKDRKDCSGKQEQYNRTESRRSGGSRKTRSSDWIRTIMLLWLLV